MTYIENPAKESVATVDETSQQLLHINATAAAMQAMEEQTSPISSTSPHQPWGQPPPPPAPVFVHV